MTDYTKVDAEMPEAFQSADTIPLPMLDLDAARRQFVIDVINANIFPGVTTSEDLLENHHGPALQQQWMFWLVDRQYSSNISFYD